MKTTRLSEGKTVCVVLSLSLFLVFSSLPIHLQGALAAQQEDISTEILEGAKKEGKLLWYVAQDYIVPLKFKDQFHEKYPFIQMDIYRGGAVEVLTRLLAEEAAKKHIVDVVLISGGEGLTLKKKGFYGKYISPQSKFFPEGFKDPEGGWTDVYMSMNGIVYNTKLVSPQDVPTSWHDLLNPKWKGKIGMDTRSFEWFGYILKIMGEKNGLEYMEKLSEQKVRFYPGRPAVNQLLAAGEISLALGYKADIEGKKDKGAAVEWAGIEPIIPSIHPFGLSAHAPHPNAAKLFVDFMLSREGQETWARLYYGPSRPDVKPLRMKKELKIYSPDFAIINNYDNLGISYRKVLMKK